MAASRTYFTDANLRNEVSTSPRRRNVKIIPVVMAARPPVPAVAQALPPLHEVLRTLEKKIPGWKKRYTQEAPTMASLIGTRPASMPHREARVIAARNAGSNAKENTGSRQKKVEAPQDEKKRTTEPRKRTKDKSDQVEDWPAPCRLKGCRNNRNRRGLCQKHLSTREGCENNTCSSYAIPNQRLCAKHLELVIDQQRNDLIQSSQQGRPKRRRYNTKN